MNGPSPPDPTMIDLRGVQSQDMPAMPQIPQSNVILKFNGQDLTRQSLHQDILSIGQKRLLAIPPQKVNSGIQSISGFFAYLRIIF
jgi:hypothetical protein